MFDAEDPVAQAEAYAAIGQLLVTWALIDQAIIRSLWRRDRRGLNLPVLEHNFPRRWKDWSSQARTRWPGSASLTWEDFDLEQANAQAIRNALAHWTIGVRGRSGRFSVLVQPYELSDRRRKLMWWVDLVRHQPLLKRYPTPNSGQPSLWWDWQLHVLLARWEALLAVTRHLAVDDEGGDITDALGILAKPQEVFLS